MSPIRVQSLHLYPVKSAAGLAVQQSVVEPWGLAADRRWAVVDATGRRVDGSRYRRILQVRPVPTETGLRLSAPGRAPIEVAFPDPAIRQPTAHTRLESAVPAGAAADRWLSEWLGTEVHLVWLDDPRLRPMSAAHGGSPDEPLSLADAGPVLLISQGSLTELDRWMAELAGELGEVVPKPLATTRFRPNVVIDGDEPFAEDRWRRLRIGEVDFRFAELCDRCVITTIDPVTLAGGKEPIRTLARHRRWQGKTWFGARLIPTSPGTVRVGDELRVGSSDD